MQYIDSNVFIYSVTEPESDKGIAAKNTLIKVAKGETGGITSVLTWDEVVWIIKKAFNMELAILEGRRFLEFPNVKIVTVDANILYSAQKLMEAYKIAPRDSIHAATAITRNVTEFISDDSDLDIVKELKRIPLSRR
jgi:hypothetical protein